MLKITFLSHRKQNPSALFFFFFQKSNLKTNEHYHVNPMLLNVVSSITEKKISVAYSMLVSLKI